MIFDSIAIASDHRGYRLKQQLIGCFEDCGYNLTDFGTNADTPSVDYPDYAKKVAEYVISHKNSCGILICYSGVGMSIAANRFKGMRAVLCYSEEIAKLSREHNNANILCLGAEFIAPEDALNLSNIFFTTTFDERHSMRIKKLDI